MDRQKRPLRQCTRWFDILATRFPNLSRAEVRTLALWSFAATLTQHIGLTTCAGFLANLFDRSFGNFRQRLRELYLGTGQKRGSSRRALNVKRCFAPLLQWVLRLWQRTSDGPDGAGPDGAGTLVLALDATLVRDRLAILSISVLLRGSAVPVAWAMTRAGDEGSWVRLCRRLFERLAQAGVPTDRPVLVLTDRGLESRRIFEIIAAHGWHPMMRLTRRGTWREEGQTHWYALSDLLSGPGRYYLGRGHLYKTNPFACTLLAIWEEGYSEPWLLMTNLSPQQCHPTAAEHGEDVSAADASAKGVSAACYGLRAWIEQGFRCLKGGAYHYQRTRIVDPVRAERMWLVLAVSLLWTHALGAIPVTDDPAAGDEAFGPGLLGRFRVGVRRVLGVHRSGWIQLLVAALRGEDLPLPKALVAGPLPNLPPDLVVLRNLSGADPPS